MNDPLRIAICEDNEKDTQSLLCCIKESGFCVRYTTFKSGEAFFEKFKPGLFHLVFLDIYMGNLTGMETASKIREVDSYVMLAFTTTSKDHAFEAQRHHSLLYIEKPVIQEMVTHTLTLAEAMRQMAKREVMTIPCGNKRKLDIRYGDIRYVEVKNKHCILYLTMGITIEAATTIGINELETMLPKPRFYRTHRSYIVAFGHVDYPNETDFVMKGGGIVYITQKEYRRVIEAYDEYLFSNAREGGYV